MLDAVYLVCLVLLTDPLTPGVALSAFSSPCVGLQGGCAHWFLGVDIHVSKWTFCACFRKNRRSGRRNCNHLGGKQYFGCPFLRSSGQISPRTLVWWKEGILYIFFLPVMVCFIIKTENKKSLYYVTTHRLKLQIMEKSHSPFFILCLDQTEVSFKCWVSFLQPHSSQNFTFSNFA